jgi:hypothetical protein
MVKFRLTKRIMQVHEKSTGILKVRDFFESPSRYISLDS